MTFKVRIREPEFLSVTKEWLAAQGVASGDIVDAEDDPRGFYDESKDPDAYRSKISEARRRARQFRGAVMFKSAKTGETVTLFRDEVERL